MIFLFTEGILTLALILVGAWLPSFDAMLSPAFRSPRRRASSPARCAVFFFSRSLCRSCTCSARLSGERALVWPRESWQREGRPLGLSNRHPPPPTGPKSYSKATAGMSTSLLILVPYAVPSIAAAGGEKPGGSRDLARDALNRISRGRAPAHGGAGREALQGSRCLPTPTTVSGTRPFGSSWGNAKRNPLAAEASGSQQKSLIERVNRGTTRVGE